jgi:predicted ArsR family transcriptional regulator
MALYNWAMSESELRSLPVIVRREIEARILAPFVESLAQEFGRDRVVAILKETIVRIAREQGAALAAQQGGNALNQFADATAAWIKNDALTIEVMDASETRYDFNVTRCRYAEMYRELGIPELGAVLSCNRDASLIEGYNSDVELTRTQTLMNGASHCDFRYRKK